VPRDPGDRNVFSFAVDPGQTGDDVYDDVRGWAIGKAIPIMRHIDR
jgi:hypothetical protein